MGNKTLEFAYFLIMISNRDYVIHINNDNDSSFNNMFHKQSVVRLTLGVTKPLYSLGEMIKPSSRRLLDIQGIFSAQTLESWDIFSKFDLIVKWMVHFQSTFKRVHKSGSQFANFIVAGIELHILKPFLPITRTFSNLFISLCWVMKNNSCCGSFQLEKFYVN